MRKIFISIFAAGFLLTAVQGCQQMELVEGRPGLEGGVQVPVSLSCELLDTEKDNPGTRSQHDVSSLRKISNAGYYLFRNGAYVGQQYFDNIDDFIINLPSSTDKYNVYILANAGEIKIPESTSESQIGSAVHLDYKSRSNYFSTIQTYGFPMATALKDFTASTGGDIELRRLVHTLYVKVDTDDLVTTQIDFKSLNIRNAARDVFPFASGGSKARYVMDGDAANLDADEMEAINNGEEVTLFLLENMRGELFPGNTDWKRKTPKYMSSDTEQDYCSYIEMECGANTVSTTYENVIYRAYVGRTAADCNVERHVYSHLNNNFVNNAIVDEDWRIVSEMNPNLSVKSTANCYIVPKGGQYYFTATHKGNSTHEYDRLQDPYEAIILWQSHDGSGYLIKDVSYSNGVISFTAHDKNKGNAAIALRNKSGVILWSWHIWMTDQPSDQIYRNNAGIAMDRNLGATSATPEDPKTIGLLYQWGRKDPFPGTKAFNSEELVSSTVHSGYEWDYTSYERHDNYAIENPLIMIDDQGIPYDWFLVPDYERWAEGKTINDPCPPGYMVPKGGPDGLWAKAIGEEYIRLDKNEKGFNLGASNSLCSLTEDDICWYPLTGSDPPGFYFSTMYCDYWSHTVQTDSYHGVYAFALTNLGVDAGIDEGFKSTCNPVRCVVDTERKDAPAHNLSRDGTANSYIVPAAGDYRFYAKYKGNSTSEKVGTISSVEVLWESAVDAVSVGDLITNAKLDSDNYISFTASGRKGNAVIAAKNSSGTVLWSWHIWLTDRPHDQVYNNNAGTVMDRNLGAISATQSDGQKTWGLLYQWGRKDPFPGKDNRTKSYTTVSTVQSSDYAVQNPYVFIFPSSNVGLWLTAQDDKRWDTNGDGTGSKTINDPCPPGYKVPRGGADGLWGQAFGSNKTKPTWNNGYNFGQNGSYMSLTTEASCWYPTTGWIASSGKYSESFAGDKIGSYWGSTPVYTMNQYRAYVFSSAKNSARVDGTNTLIPGNSVRCVKE